MFVYLELPHAVVSHLLSNIWGWVLTLSLLNCYITLCLTLTKFTKTPVPTSQHVPLTHDQLTDDLPYS